MFGRAVKIFLLAAFIVITAQSRTFAEETELLEIVNDTDEPIWALYIAPVVGEDGDADWNDDLVGSEIMYPGDSRITYYDPAYRYFHVKIVLANKEEYILPNVDFFDTWKINIWYDGIDYQVNKNSRG